MQDIIIVQKIPAPRDRVFRALTDPADLVNWHHAGDGWYTPFAETDLRVGGTYRIGYSAPDKSMTFTLEGQYREISAPERLVYGIGPDREVKITLEEDGAESTVLTVAFTPENVNPEELQRNGWSMHYANLAAYLEKLGR